MNEFLQRLRQRKLVQWAIAYVAAAFALLQGIDIIAQQFGWPEGLRRGITLALVIGFFVALLLAWYHGERGAQKVSGPELLILAVILAIGGGLLWRFAGTPSKPAATSATAPAEVAATPDVTAAPSQTAVAIPAKSVAVLPFENLSAEKDNAYFADGIQDEILTGLAKIGDLKVISRTSTQGYGSRPQNLAEIGRQLGVAHVLEGSVQKAGNRVRVNVQLIDAASDDHLWAETYDRTLEDVFAVETEVAQKIASSLQAQLTRDERAALTKKPTDNPAAYDAYLKARSLLLGSSYDRREHRTHSRFARERGETGPRLCRSLGAIIHHELLDLLVGVRSHTELDWPRPNRRWIGPRRWNRACPECKRRTHYMSISASAISLLR